MTRRTAHLAALGAIALGATAFAHGGWAVVTVDDLPEHLVVGRPMIITFAVRQHGQTLLDNLRGSVVARAKDGAAVTARANATGNGKYAASLVIPRSGDWTIAVNSGFGNSGVTLEPIRAVGPGQPIPASATPVDRGRRLFSAKGCVTCHLHGGIEGSGIVNVGPDLTPKRYQPEYLARYLADPSIARTPKMQFTMPALGLEPAEIAALVAFINKN